jgi:acetyl esterase/lipase
VNLCVFGAAILLATAIAAAPSSAQSVSKPIPIWPGTAPGEKGDIGVEHDTSPQKDGKPADGIIRIGNVSVPTLTVYSPPADKANGTAVIVCPGGGYAILAYDLEGSEVCQRLNRAGVTAILLKYRVPVRAGLPRYGPPLQDAQRAIGLTRQNATQWHINPNRIGILGFSAGGHLSAAASTNFDSRTYPVVDAADQLSCRPDFTVLIYPAYLTQDADRTKLAPEIKVTAQTPPAFMAMTIDDPVHVENIFAYGLALKAAGVPFEMHAYPKGGHGYGLRPSENEVVKWPDRLESWMEGRGLLKK